MTMREIYNAGALSEFVAGYNGDCGETAEICLLHVLNPSAYPLDAAALAPSVRRDIDHGWASANGAEPISSIAHDLDALGVAYVNAGYSEPPAFNWAAQLASVGGVKPIIFEIAQAFALPGDEAGVHYHFITCLGWDPEANAGIFADGDNERVRAGASGPAGLVTYSLGQLQAARVCGMLTSVATPPPPPPPPAPAPTGMRAYTVVSGDNLFEIAHKLGLNSWYHDLYQPNMATIEAAARRYGHPDSNGGNLIFPGEVLHYQG